MMPGTNHNEGTDPDLGTGYRTGPLQQNCWKCEKEFTWPEGQSVIQCPHCGAYNEPK